MKRSGLGVIGAGVVALAGVGAGTWLVSSGDAQAVEVPSPLFGEVEQLTLTSLPDGWARCDGGASTRPEATARWWSQTFGPVIDGDCDPLVTVTQVPPDEHVRIPPGASNSGIGEAPGRTGAKRWSDRVDGSLGLYTTGSGGLQLLVVEGCCGSAVLAEGFDVVANAARDATRERQPARCTELHSRLDDESFLTNYFARQQRVLDDDDCPVRGDVVTWRRVDALAHCYAGVQTITIGDPVGSVFDEDGGRSYVRDPDALLSHADGPDPLLDLDATLPEGATDTGFHQDDRTIWLDDADDQRIYVVADDHVEAWPLDTEQHGCA